MIRNKPSVDAQVTIRPPNFQTAAFRITGTAPYCQNNFSQKAHNQIRVKQEAGSAGKKGQKREPKDFQACYEGAKHKSSEGWCGIPATAFRKAMVSACRVVGFKMTLAKLAVFVEADGFGEDGTPLVRILKGEPKYHEAAVRNENGVCDLRARPMWAPGWEADVRVRFDADLFTVEDIANLLMRVGQQVGIGEGRPDSTNSCGMGWGMFRILEPKEKGR